MVAAHPWPYAWPRIWRGKGLLPQACGKLRARPLSLAPVLCARERDVDLMSTDLCLVADLRVWPWQLGCWCLHLPVLLAAALSLQCSFHLYSVWL